MPQDEKAALESSGAAAAASAAEQQAAAQSGLAQTAGQLEEVTRKLEAAAGAAAAGEQACAELRSAKAAVEQEMQEHVEYADQLEGTRLCRPLPRSLIRSCTAPSASLHSETCSAAIEWAASRFSLLSAPLALLPGLVEFLKFRHAVGRRTLGA